MSQSESDEEHDGTDPSRSRSGMKGRRLALDAGGWGESGSSSGSAVKAPPTEAAGEALIRIITQSVSAAARRPGAPDAETGSARSGAKTARCARRRKFAPTAAGAKRGG